MKLFHPNCRRPSGRRPSQLSRRPLHGAGGANSGSGPRFFPIERNRLLPAFLTLVLWLLLGGWPVARAAPLTLPQQAQQGLHELYAGQTDTAIEAFRAVQRAQPQHPLGYLLEANARWWKIYCEACEIKWNMMDAWKRDAAPGDDEYLALVDNGIQLAEAQNKNKPTADMYFYAGMGYALRARLHALRFEKRATARAGVKARENLLEAVRLDPQLADAYLGLGLYNYYVDSLSGFVKVLRFFMGIPGGSKKDGLEQLEKAIAGGQLTPPEARFYLAKNLRNNEQQYARGVEVLLPLLQQYPANPLLHLILGDLQAKLSRNSEAAASFRAAQQLVQGKATPCASRIRQLSTAALASLPATK